MDKLSKAIMAIGGAIAALFGCALGSDGIYSYYAGLVVLGGMVVVGVGYGLRILARKRCERKRDLYYFRQRSRQDEDIIWIEEAR